MNETVREEEGTLNKPECWNLPEKKSYWSCLGHDIEPKRWLFQKRIRGKPDWRCLFYTKEEAEAYTTMVVEWKWDKQPARQFGIAESLYEARKMGDLGIRVKSYRNGEWVIVEEYPCGVPLPEWEIE